MASTCQIFFRNFGTSLSKIISTKLRVSPVGLDRNYSQDEQQDKTSLKPGAFAEFYEKTKENKQTVEEDQDFEVLLRNSNFINVTIISIK
jgi:hypothetical protein